VREERRCCLAGRFYWFSGSKQDIQTIEKRPWSGDGHHLQHATSIHTPSISERPPTSSPGSTCRFHIYGGSGDRLAISALLLIDLGHGSHHSSSGCVPESLCVALCMHTTQ
jgi:hypothetical protein